MKILRTLSQMFLRSEEVWLTQAEAAARTAVEKMRKEVTDHPSGGYSVEQMEEIVFQAYSCGYVEGQRDLMAILAEATKEDLEVAVKDDDNLNGYSRN